jgi:hypothetical protein
MLFKQIKKLADIWVCFVLCQNYELETFLKMRSRTKNNIFEHICYNYETDICNMQPLYNIKTKKMYFLLKINISQKCF